MTSGLPEAREPALVDAFIVLADTLVAGHDMVDLLYRLIEACTHLLATDFVGILLSDRRGQLQVMAYSTEEVRLLEQFQLQVNEGPCLDCSHTGRAVSAPDLTETVDRWPQFAPRAAQEGFRAVHALPMRLRTQTIGVLNLFTAQPGPLPPGDLRVGQALADVATVGILYERALCCSEIHAEQLQTALNSRIIIEQAKGLLFVLLLAHARRKRLRLSDVARGVVEGSITLDTLSWHGRKLTNP
jgi:GAF domain-containing protein